MRKFSYSALYTFVYAPSVGVLAFHILTGLEKCDLYSNSESGFDLKYISVQTLCC